MRNVVEDTYKAYTPRPFTAAEKDSVTIVFGGLTWRAERLFEALFRSAGYKARRLPDVTLEDLFRGRELVDTGQCCPTAFTTGNLANFLIQEAKRIGPEKVVEDYVYVTAGACGACRFGQYHQSYELALKNLGLEDFRLFLVQQHQIDQPTKPDDGLKTDAHLLLGAVTAILAADAIQDLEYQIRPYEVEKGATDRAAKLAIEEVYNAMLTRPIRKTKFGAILWHLTSRRFNKALRRARRHFEDIKVDRLQVKPKVKITGEFYLATVEGIQNYNIHSWLESEGAEVSPAGIGIWFDFLLRYADQKLEDRKGIIPKVSKKRALVKLASYFYHRRYNAMRRALGGIPHALPDQAELRRLASPFFHSRINGGEGDLLVAEAIWHHVNRKAHMMCEMSPYACLPNTMSIGAMAEVQGRYPNLLYAPLEIKGDSEVHALSRCQMVLTEAKSRARQEFKEALRVTSLTLEQARERIKKHPHMESPFWKVPDRGAVGTAANLVLELGGADL